MKDFWGQRYSEPGFAYGMEANAFFREVLDLLALTYIHLLPDTRLQAHCQLSACLKPGGKIIME